MKTKTDKRIRFNIEFLDDSKEVLSNYFVTEKARKYNPFLAWKRACERVAKEPFNI